MCCVRKILQMEMHKKVMQCIFHLSQRDILLSEEWWIPFLRFRQFRGACQHQFNLVESLKYGHVICPQSRFTGEDARAIRLRTLHDFTKKTYHLLENAIETMLFWRHEETHYNLSNWQRQGFSQILREMLYKYTEIYPDGSSPFVAIFHATNAHELQKMRYWFHAFIVSTQLAPSCLAFPLSTIPSYFFVRNSSSSRACFLPNPQDADDMCVDVLGTLASFFYRHHERSGYRWRIPCQLI